uniref:relaxase/mobilization nuclease domain-containing protein n=1 Tax=Methylomonas sp. SPW-1 TaxID=3438877 RepID=UPI00402B4581
MPKKRTAVVARDKTAPGLDLISRGRKGPSARPLFDPSSPESMASLQRTLDRVPEVMVKVTGGGRDPETAEAHIDYIDRKGELEVLTDEGEFLKGKDVSAHLVKDWKLDTVIHQRHRDAPLPGEKDKRAKLVHNIVLSMPQGTPPQKVLEAAEFFARENFALSNRYAMVLHDPATDPKRDKTESGKNPHVHLVVKAVSETGERLYIRKDTLQIWREQFAQALRDRGIEANATPAAIRGKGKSSAKTAIHQHQERIEQWRSGTHDKQSKPVASTLLQGRVEQVINELINGVTPDLTGKEKLKATRQTVMESWVATENALREAGFSEKADQVVEFIKTLPPVKSDYDILKDKMVADKNRLQEALGQKMPSVDKTVTRYDDFTQHR